MLALIKKDFYILKKQILFILFFDIFMIGYLSFQMQEMGKIGTCLVFVLTGLISVLLLKSTISIQEAKYKKSLSLICATPCGRWEVVAERYLFDYIVFLCFAILYILESLIYSVVILPPIWFFAASFLLICCYHGVVIPVEIKFGYEKSKYITTIGIFALPFLSPMLINKLGDKNINLLKIAELPEGVKCILLIILALIVELCSYYISNRIFKKKEL